MIHHNGIFFIFLFLLILSQSPQVWVRLHGQHIHGSPFPVPLNMGAIANDYSKRLGAAEAAGSSPDLGGEEGCAGDFVVVTGASSGFFDRAVNLVGSVPSVLTSLR